jgi:mRNA-degrading endonuclease YafQ of YafQ-DinJ toxin-antitoxin module
MPPPKHTFRRSSAFRRAFDALPPRQQAAARACFVIFRKDIFDPRLNNHIIQRLSALYKQTIRSITIEGDLKVVYKQDGNVVTALDIGKHAIYQ